MAPLRWLLHLLLFPCLLPAEGQGDLQHLKENLYMQDLHLRALDCDSLTDIQVNTMTDRYCENLRLQRADSVLKARCDRYEQGFTGEDAQAQLLAFRDLQDAWRTYRDTHCRPDCAEIRSNGAAANCMWCMRRITEVRIAELDLLLESER
ncbi:MAG: DUF1311 domain-containing protein [Flavobacteriales bacterium]|nr:DUF1311 domain-containing protein [Flavobacteriales bacterium]